MRFCAHRVPRAGCWRIPNGTARGSRLPPVYASATWPRLVTPHASSETEVNRPSHRCDDCNPHGARGSATRGIHALRSAGMGGLGVARESCAAPSRTFPPRTQRWRHDRSRQAEKRVGNRLRRSARLARPRRQKPSVRAVRASPRSRKWLRRRNPRAGRRHRSGKARGRPESRDRSRESNALRRRCFSRVRRRRNRAFRPSSDSSRK